ncbi:recombinase family protein [Bradyrhizobium sp. McL0616]|uniref:recombinase family protein n=1 Tax=Bradyrhizobium sp. McL0616 TaxID=3415674 RepID=UPI003CF6EE71
MANALIVRPRTDLLSPTSAGRAAQYVRMSTEHQRYSIENQAAAVAVYAAQIDLAIVRTYRDEGRSGLRIQHREGLIELIDDVRGGRADFDHILVYDVSRWGRFQDIDESAYYEFTCRQAGIKVCYCAEEFDNDGSMIASIVKNLKRVIPHQEVIFLDETDDKVSPMKAKGVAELGICGAAAAVANAVYNATGVRVRDYPVTLDKHLDRLPAVS